MADNVTNISDVNVAADTSPLNEKYKAFVANNQDNINTMYDAARTSNLTGLESAYQQNLSDYQAQKGAIDKQYNTAANDLAIQYERNRMNNLLQAQMNGLNAGTGSQAQLALGSNYNRDFGKLRGEQAAQQMEQDRQINNLTAQYRYQVQQALADNDYGRAAALVDEANNQVSQLKDAYNLQTTDLGNAAALLAEAGDYSGYQDLYGYTNDQVDALRTNWAMSNPDAAYKAGVISGGEYYQLTGNWPYGYDPWGGSGDGSGSGTGSIADSYYGKALSARDRWNAEHPDKKISQRGSLTISKQYGTGWDSKLTVNAATGAIELKTPAPNTPGQT